MSVIPDDVRALLQAPNFVHLATLLPDGSPHSVPVWAGLQDNRVLFFTQPTSRKARNLEDDSRVALSLTDIANPYLSARLRGRVVGTRTGEDALQEIDRISMSYTGQPFPMRGGTLYEIEITSAATMDLPFRHEPPTD